MIENDYGSNCGTYTTTIEAVDSDCDFSHLLTVSIPSVQGGNNALQYSQSIILEYEGYDNAEAGSCEM